MALTLTTLPTGTALRLPAAAPRAPGYTRCYGRLSVLAPQGRAGALLPVAGASVRVYLPGTSTPYTGELFATASGTTPLAFPALTDTDGSLELWSEVPLRLDVTIQSQVAGSARETVDIEPPPDAADPYPLYATDADLAAHKASADDHPGYVDPTELAAALGPYATDADLAAHAAAPDPHPVYLLPVEADAAYESLTRYGANNGYTPLDANGLVPPQHMPPIAITDTYVVMSEAEMLALPAQVGDIAIRVENPPRKDTYILAADPATTLANWILLGTTVIAGNVTVVRRQEFAPAPGSPSVTLTGAPTEIISLTRNGVQQSALAGDYALAGAVVGFSTPFALGEKVVVAYSVGVSIAVDTYTKAESHALFVDVLGDTMTGPLTVGTPALGPMPITLDGQAGTTRSLGWTSSGLPRWRLEATATLEAGADAGSDLSLTRYDDAGGVLPSVLTASRATGVVDFVLPPTVAGVPLLGADHLTDPDPHPQYVFDTELAAHLASTDDHPLYATDADLAAHAAAADPHAPYILQTEADAQFVDVAGDTMTGGLGFTPDNTLDLGQAATDRPRNVYAGTDVIAGGRVGISDGTVLAPSLFFTADANTGLHRRGTNELAFVTSGDLWWYIDTNGVLAAGTDDTVDIGKATHRPRHLYLSQGATIAGNAVAPDAVTAGNRLTWGPDGFFVPPALVQADLDAHEAAADPHPVYATDVDLANHLAAADPHAVYLTAAEGDALFLTPAEGDLAYANVAGDTFTGAVYLPAANPTGATEATTKAYVDAQIANANLYQGTWMVAGNSPDLDPLVALPLNGYSWIAVTVDPQVAEVAPATLPGIGGTTVFNGDVIKWNAGLAIYEHIQGSSLSRAQADALYLSLMGGTVTGAITLPGDPASALEAAPKQYVDATIAAVVADRVALAGDTMTGALYLPAAAPTGATQATHKQYVDETVANNALYQGIWNVASNTPDLQVPPLAPLNGYSWITQTVDPSVPESPPVALPGIPITTVIDSGWTIRWNGNTSVYELIRGPSLSLAAAQGFFVDITGDTMTGPLTIGDGTTAVTGEAITLDQPAGARRNRIQGQKAGVLRWGIDLGDTASETGSNVGSDFALYRWNDAGGYVAPPVIFGRRSTGAVTVGLDLDAHVLTSRGGGPSNAPAAAIRLGYSNQGGGTYVHEIRSGHHGGVMADNAIEFWLHGSSAWNPAQTNASPAVNRALRVAGDLVTSYKPLAAPGGTFTDHLVFNGTNKGVTFTGGSRVYAWTDKPLTLMEAPGKQPRIIDTTGLNARDIIDTVNGDARYATPASVTTAITTHQAAADPHPTYLDQTRGDARYLQLGGTNPASTFAPTVTLQLPNESNVRTVLFQFLDTHGFNRNVQGQIATNRTGFYGYGPYADLELYAGCGGFSVQRGLTIQGTQTSTPNTYCDGSVSAANFINRSDMRLKRDIVDLFDDAAQARDAFAKLRPVRYQRLRPPPVEGPDGKVQEEPVVDEVGFVAQDVQAALPAAVSEGRASPDDEPMLGYSLPGLMALMAAELKRLGDEVEALKRRRRN